MDRGEAERVRTVDESEYRDFVVARMSGLRRTAYLLCRDWHAADDLVATALDKLYRRWPRRAEIDDLDAYVRAILSRAWVDETRRPWRREHATGDIAPASEPVSVGPESGVTDRMTLDTYLGGLDPRFRAVLVLRFYCDMSVRETADVLGLSIGTVKSQTARGLAALRAFTTDQSLMGER